MLSLIFFGTTHLPFFLAGLGISNTMSTLCGFFLINDHKEYSSQSFNILQKSNSLIYLTKHIHSSLYPHLPFSFVLENIWLVDCCMNNLKIWKFESCVLSLQNVLAKTPQPCHSPSLANKIQ